MARVAAIYVYPFKSLDPVPVQSARMLESGALQWDRTFALMDAQDKYVNGKRHARIHQLRSSFDAMLRTVTLAGPATRRASSFHVDHQREELNAWLSEFFGFAVHVAENESAGFPDDTDAPGPTLISTATLREVASWFPGISLDSIRRRFRSNIEIDGVPPFWEDRLYGPAGVMVPFRVGAIALEGTNPCQRCAVPPRDPSTGQAIPDFVKTFSARREQTLPPWAERSRFNHFYRLAINTRLSPGSASALLSCGDTLAIEQPR